MRSSFDEDVVVEKKRRFHASKNRFQDEEFSLDNPSGAAHLEETVSESSDRQQNDFLSKKSSISSTIKPTFDTSQEDTASETVSYSEEILHAATPIPSIDDLGSIEGCLKEVERLYSHTAGGANEDEQSDNDHAKALEIDIPATSHSQTHDESHGKAYEHGFGSRKTAAVAESIRQSAISSSGISIEDALDVASSEMPTLLQNVQRATPSKESVKSVFEETQDDSEDVSPLPPKEPEKQRDTPYRQHKQRPHFPSFSEISLDPQITSEVASCIDQINVPLSDVYRLVVKLKNRAARLHAFVKMLNRRDDDDTEVDRLWIEDMCRAHEQDLKDILNGISVITAVPDLDEKERNE